MVFYTVVLDIDLIDVGIEGVLIKIGTRTTNKNELSRQTINFASHKVCVLFS